MAKPRQLEQIRCDLKRMKTIDRKISSLEEQLKRMKIEKEMLYTEYSEFIAASKVDSAIRLLEENEKNFKLPNRTNNKIYTPKGSAADGKI